MSKRSPNTPAAPQPFWQWPILKWLFSLRVGLVFLILLTLASIYGTLITPLERAQELVYYAWWYKYLLLLPTTITMACSTVRTIFEKILPADRPRFMHGAQFYKTSPNAAEIPFTGDAAAAAAAFRRRGYRVNLEGAYGHVTRGHLRLWGAPISHLGFVVVMLGGFASAWVAREGWVNLYEGQQTEMMMERGSPVTTTTLGFTMRCDDFQTGFFPKTRIPSRFTSIVSVRTGDGPWMTQPVEVNRSFVVNGWSLHQTSYQETKEQERYQLAVAGPDHPTTLTLNVSPGQRRPIPGLAGIEIELSQPGGPLAWRIHKNGRPAGQANLNSAAGGGYRIRAVQFEPDFVMGDKIGSRSQQLNNPALKIALLQGEQSVATQWLFSREDFKQMMAGMHAQEGPFTYDLLRVGGQAPEWKPVVAVRGRDGVKIGEYTLGVGEELPLGPDKPAAEPAPDAASGGWRVKIVKPVPAYITTLTLTRNPAIPVIYGGCALMVLGLLVVFFVRRREEWFWVDAAAGRLRVAAKGLHLQSGVDGLTNKVLADLEKVESKIE